MDDRLAFMTAIRHKPTDDLLRLIYADWLDEHQEPLRAEFIRLQIELSKLDHSLSSIADRMKAREYELIKTNLKGWLRDDGFPEDFPEWIAEFVLPRINGRMQEFSRPFVLGFERGFLNTLRFVAKGIETAGIQALMSSPGLTSITRLELRHNRIDDDGVRAIATSTHLKSLTELSLGRNMIGYRGVEDLCRSAMSLNLLSLDLNCNHIHDRGARMIVNSGQFKNLKFLDLSCNGLTEEGWEVIRSSPLAGITRIW